MKKVIITGAGGFLGRQLCKVLVDQEIQVIAIVRNISSLYVHTISASNNIDVVEYKDFMVGNTSDTDRYKNVDAIIHLAWHGTHGNLRENTEIQIENIQIVCRLMKFCAEIGCKRFFYASSIMEYEIQKLMKSESNISAAGIYSVAKLSADYIARILANNLGIIYVRGIISNVYGPGEKSSRLINTAIRKLLKGEACSFSSGEQIYDFIYIDDAVKIITAITEKGHNNREYYIGSQNPHKLKEFLTELGIIMGASSNLHFGKFPDPAVTIKYDEFDIYAVEKDLNIIPKVCFEEGIRKTIEWIQKEDT